MRAEGWYRDPYGIHRDRWYSDGQPTSLVRDGAIESRDAPPPGDPPAAPVPLDLTPTDASDMKRADEATRTSLFADEPGAYRLVRTRFGRGLLAAGLGVCALITSFFLRSVSMRIEAVALLTIGTWSAGSAVVARRRERRTVERWVGVGSRESPASSRPVAWRRQRWQRRRAR